MLDDVQAISHHMMQPPAGTPDPHRLRAGLKLNPDDHWTRIQFVRQMAAAGELDLAARELQKLEREPEKWDVHLAAAGLHEARGRWDEAAEALQSALVLSPSNAVLHFELAKAYDHMGRTSESDKYLAAALALDRGEISTEVRESAAVRLAIGNAQAEARSARAPLSQTMVQQAEAGDTTAQMALAQTAFGQGRIEEGLDWLRRAAAQGSALAQLTYGRGLLAARGQAAGKEVLLWLTRSAKQGYDEAQHDLGLILYDGRLAPKDMGAAYAWVSLAAAQGNKKARSLLREMDLFIRPEELAEARKRADAFTPKKEPMP